MTRRTNETQVVKQALLAEGIKAKVDHGTGTARSWLEVRLPYTPEYARSHDYHLLRTKVEDIVAKAAGRETWPDNYILVTP